MAEVVQEIPWWKHPDNILYNTDYEPHPNALKLLDRADVIVIFFGIYPKRNTRLIGKYLSRFQTKVNENGGKVQLIFSSMDENEKDCQLFAKKLEGEWLIIPWANQVARRTARNQCNVVRPPSVVALRNAGEGIVVSVEGKVEILEMGDAAYWMWRELRSPPHQTRDQDTFY